MHAQSLLYHADLQRLRTAPKIGNVVVSHGKSATSALITAAVR